VSNILSIAGRNSKYKLSDAKPAGFLAGLWHGLIIPITFIVSLFNSNVSIYETDNTNKGYHFGFIIGLTALSQNTILIQFGSNLT
jgi:hypothetical protein